MKISTNFLTTVFAVIALAMGFAAVPLPNTFAGSDEMDPVVEMGQEQRHSYRHLAG